MSPTPTNNVHLPARLADFASLPEALDYAARGDTGFNFYSARGELTAVLPYRELREQAISVARGLNKAQLKRGSRLLLIADTTPEFAVMFFACQYAGVIGVPVSLPTTLGGRDAYVEGLRRQLMGCGAIAAAAPSELNEYLRAAAAGLELWLVGTFTDFFELPRSTTDSKPFGPAEPCYLQYSSGSTRARDASAATYDSAVALLANQEWTAQSKRGSPTTYQESRVKQTSWRSTSAGAAQRGA